MALAQYREKFWFPSGALAANIPARVFLYDDNVLAPLFTDATGTTAKPNPTRTDAEGYLDFWAEEGTYWLHIDTESFEIFVGGSGEEATEGWVLQQIGIHNADTTDVHGIPDTSDLLTSADLDGYATDAELAAHEADTTNVHGIPNTAVLETQAGAQARADQAEADAIAAAGIDATAKANLAQANAEQTAANALAGHEADTTNVHGIPDTSALLTDADLAGYATDAELAAHAADTTAVHGIANTADLATDADVAAVSASLADHVADTTGVHGIANTADLLTSADLEDYATDAELAAHAADTTAVHGIADTSVLVTDADLAGYATDADVALVQADIDAHEADTTNVHGIPDTSVLVTDGDLAGYATQAELTALQTNLSDHVDDTTDVHGIANTADLLTSADIANLATDAELAAVQAELDAHEADTTAVHGIPDTSVLVTDADLAGLATDAELADVQSQLDAHEGATTSVHGIGDTAELETLTGSQAKADAALAAAIADAAAKYLNRITGGTVTGEVTMDGANLVVKRADDAGAYRLRVTGGALDFEVAPEVIVSVWENPDFTGAQTNVMRWEASGPHLIGRVRLGTTPYDAIFDFDTANAEATFNGDLVLTGTLNGIAVADLETEAGAQAKVDAHNADTTAVHGIADTSQLVTDADLAAYATDADLAAHEADTTNVHGITNTANLETTTGAQAKADAALAAAIADAATKYLNRTTGGTVTGTITAEEVSAATAAFAAIVGGDTFDRFRALASGQLEWGPGNAARDTVLRRSAANELTTDDALVVALTLAVTGNTTLTGQLLLNNLLRVTRAAATDSAWEARVTGDANARHYALADGKLHWGPGNAGADVTLYRAAADVLATDDNLQVAGQIAQTRPLTTSSVRDVRVTGDTQPRFYQVATGQMYWGPGNAAVDTLLYRDGVGSLVTDGNFTVNGRIFSGYLQQTEADGVTVPANYTLTDALMRNTAGVTFVHVEITTDLALTTPGGTSGNITPDLTICTVPAAWRPPDNLYIAVGTGIGHGTIRVQTDGQCQLLTWIPSQSVSAGSTFRFTYTFIN